MSELIKVSGDSRPLLEYMDNSITDKECDKLFKMIREYFEEDDFSKFKQTKYFTEACYLNEGKVGDFFIKGLIKAMEIFCKNKYRMQVNQFYGMSKELNDIYTKVAYLLQHDKVARFKHRNDLLSFATKSVLMRDKINAQLYNLMYATLFYNLDGVNQMVRNALSNIKDDCTKEQGETLRKAADTIVYNTNISFSDNYGYVDSCEVISYQKDYSGVKLEDSIKYFKSSVEMYYNNIKVMNTNVSDQLTYIKYIDNMYNMFMNQFGKNPDCKYYIDTVFKCVIDNMTKAMDFNNSITDHMIECIKHSSNELYKIYEILKRS